MLRPQVADFEDPIAFLDAWMTWKKRTFGVRPNTYSQRMFARDAGRPKQTSLFSHILSGRRPLRGDVLEDTIRALALPTDEEQVLRHLTVPPSERSASTARRLEGARARARARYAQCEARFSRRTGLPYCYNPICGANQWGANIGHSASYLLLFA